MSRVVEGLVRRGLAERVPSPEDRRAVRIATTPKGRRLLLTGRDRRVHLLADRLKGLDDQDLRTLRQAARLLAQL